MDKFLLFPENKSDDRENLELDPTRMERVHIPAGPPPEQLPADRLTNFEMVFMG
jgi:hypothetical protein